MLLLEKSTDETDFIEKSEANFGDFGFRLVQVISYTTILLDGASLIAVLLLLLFHVMIKFKGVSTYDFLMKRKRKSRRIASGETASVEIPDIQLPGSMAKTYDIDRHK